MGTYIIFVVIGVGLLMYSVGYVNGDSDRRDQYLTDEEEKLLDNFRQAESRKVVDKKKNKIK